MLEIKDLSVQYGKQAPIIEHFNLSNENIFGIDLYKAGIGEKIEEMFLEEIAGPGAVRAVLKKYMA